MWSSMINLNKKPCYQTSIMILVKPNWSHYLQFLTKNICLGVFYQNLIIFAHTHTVNTWVWKSFYLEIWPLIVVLLKSPGQLLINSHTSRDFQTQVLTFLMISIEFLIDWYIIYLGLTSKKIIFLLGGRIGTRHT